MEDRENIIDIKDYKDYKFNIIEKIKYILELVIVRLIGKFYKKDSKIWIFGSKAGEQFADNSMYFYKYIKENHTEIRAIWVSNNSATIRQVQDYGGEAYKIMSLRSLKYILKAKVYVYSTYLDGDIRVYYDRQTIFVNLWHGMPIKKIVYDDQTITTRDSLFSKLHKFIRKDILKYKNSSDLGDIICSTSEYTKKMMESAFRSQNVIITGQARGDIIYNYINGDNKFINNLKSSKDQKLILYMPTHRGSGKIQTKNIFENEKFTNQLIEYCNLNNCIFAIKYHPNEKMSKKIIKNEYVLDITDCNFDTQDLLIEADILITDYSSCFIDFVFTRRPVIFYAYDLEEYCTRDMGLYIDYKKDVPGPIVYDENSLFKQIMDYVSNSYQYLERYSDQILKYHKYIDNNSCKRIYDSIKKII